MFSRKTKQDQKASPVQSGGMHNRRFDRDISGSAAVEMALVIIPFIGLLVGALQMFIIFATQQVLETAAETVGRLVLTGHAPATQSAFKTAVCNAIPAFVSCSGIIIDVQAGSTFGTDQPSKPVGSINLAILEMSLFFASFTRIR